MTRGVPRRCRSRKFALLREAVKAGAVTFGKALGVVYKAGLMRGCEFEKARARQALETYRKKKYYTAQSQISPPEATTEGSNNNE